MGRTRWLLALSVLALVGCADGPFRQMMDRRRAWVLTEGAPQPASALAIAAPPTPAPVSAAPTVAAEPATNFVSEQAPPREAPAANSLRQIDEKAVAKYGSIDSYIYRLRRREVINGKQQPEELMLCKVRKTPHSVYLKWLGKEGKGREVVYVQGRFGNKIHTLTASGDVPLLPGGSRFSVSPDSRLVQSRARHPITEAGIGSQIARFTELVVAAERNDTSRGTLKYVGPVTRPEFPEPVEAVLQTIAPGGETLLPRGGRRTWHFDPAHGMPVLLVTQDETGREVEFYCHDRFEFSVHLDEDDFDPDRLWPR